MTSAVTTKAGGGACRALGMTLRAAEYEYKRGNGQPVVLDDGIDHGPPDHLAEEEANLLAQLEAVRKERAAR